MSTYLYMMGWNEILARTLGRFQAQRNVSPDWLVNPSTKRKLKLDVLYPEIGIAVRFIGMQAKGSRRKSDWEALEDEARDNVRKELCRANGVDLILITPYDSYPSNQFRQISTTLAGASRRLAKSGRFRGKAKLMEQLANARKQLDTIRPTIGKLDDLVPYAESWRDREARELADLHTPQPKTNGKRKRRGTSRAFKVGNRVEHDHFGRGTIIQVETKDDDSYLTVNFVTKGEKTLMASLAADKMAVVRT
ncbi:MAG: hypothetical protein GY759_19730 [Chloroflexi bacterium]|nr:hypothetical protein [Chloroflexota bacterium]